jgi:hypothetical protein
VDVDVMNSLSRHYTLNSLQKFSIPLVLLESLWENREKIQINILTNNFFLLVRESFGSRFWRIYMFFPLSFLANYSIALVVVMGFEREGVEHCCVLAI